jgi:hypothetical protein
LRKVYEIENGGGLDNDIAIIKVEDNKEWIDVDDDVDDEEDEGEEEDEANFPPFGSLIPKYVEFTSCFPQFPKTHIDGHATVIELDDALCNEQAINQLKESLQYSLNTKGIELLKVLLT